MTKKVNSQSNVERSIRSVSAKFVVVGASRSALYAVSWLKKAGASVVGSSSIKEAAALEEPTTAILVAGDAVKDCQIEGIDIPVIFFWDFEVGQPGIGAFASAVSPPPRPPPLAAAGSPPRRVPPPAARGPAAEPPPAPSRPVYP